MELLVSPDGKMLVAVAYPVGPRLGPTAPGSLGIWRLPGLEPLGLRSLSVEELNGLVHFRFDGTLWSGAKTLSAPGLPTATQESHEKNNLRYSGGSIDVWVDRGRGDEAYDRVMLTRGMEELLGVLSERSVSGRLWPLRRKTYADVLPSGERFLIASAPHEVETPLGTFPLPSGPTQVWCSPQQPLSLFPVAPEPEVEEVGAPPK